MKRFHFECGCIIESIMLPSEIKCRHNNLPIPNKTEKICRSCKEFFHDANPRKQLCANCSKNMKIKVCSECGRKFTVHTGTNLVCNQCRYGKSKEPDEVLREERNIYCPKYYVCRDMAAYANKLILGCESCTQYSKGGA